MKKKHISLKWTFLYTNYLKSYKIQLTPEIYVFHVLNKTTQCSSLFPRQKHTSVAKIPLSTIFSVN